MTGRRAHSVVRRREHFPIHDTTEKARANFVHGLNLADGGIREQPLEVARDGDMLAASENFTLQSGTATVSDSSWLANR